jgi:hypothetical protein
VLALRGGEFQAPGTEEKVSVDTVGVSMHVRHILSYI